MIDLGPTQRGFLRGEFTDLYGEKCSIQESSAAGDDGCIWLGCDHETTDNQGRPCGARMHLDRNGAVNIVMHLQRFIETGRLGPATPPADRGPAE